MSLHGLKKAVARLPQQLSSSGSELPEILKHLEGILDAGEKALDVLLAQSKLYSENLIGMVDSSIGILMGYDKDPKELSDLRIRLLQDAKANQHRITKPSTEMKEQLAVTRKVIAKRNRKKLDCDRFAGTMQKHEEVDSVVRASPSHQKKSAETMTSLQISQQEYTQQNGILEQKLPLVIEVLKKFLNLMLTQEHAFQLKSMAALMAFCESLAHKVNTTISPDALQCSAIVSTWRSPFMECKQAAEEGIEHLRTSKVPGMSMSETVVKTQALPFRDKTTSAHAIPPSSYSDRLSVPVQGTASTDADHKPSLPVQPFADIGSSHAAEQDIPPAYDGPVQANTDSKH